MKPSAQLEAVERLVREHGRLVFRIAYASLRNHADAEDVAQEVFMRVLRHKDSIAGLKDEKAWLAQITWRAATDRHRARPLAHLALDDEESPVPELAAREHSAHEIVSAKQTGQAIEQIIQALPQELREVLLLSAVEELNSREIGAVVGANENTVRDRLMRARRMVKAKLDSMLEVRR